MMKTVLISILFGIMAFHATAQHDDIQTDEVSASFDEFYRMQESALKYAYHAASRTHDYSGNWDFDDDHKSDSLWFTGDEGVHVYYYLKFKLSSSGVVVDCREISIDFPLYRATEVLTSLPSDSSCLPMFVVGDFNKDGHLDIYVCNNAFDKIPGGLRKQGVTSKQVMLWFENGRMIVRDFRKSWL